MYNSGGNISEEAWSEDGDTISLKKRYRYHKNGTKKEEVVSIPKANSNVTMTDHKRSEWDEEGNIINADIALHPSPTRNELG